MTLLRQRSAVAGRLATLLAVGGLAGGGLSACGDPLVLEDVPTVTLSPATITAAPGDTVRVRVSATGGAPVSSIALSASGTAARVDTSGLVTALAPGNGVISATFDFNGRRVTGSIPVTVLGINLEPIASTIAVGATTFVRVTPLGDPAAFGGLRWSSSDSSVASVDPGGNVRGLRAGIARIAVTSVNNPRVRGETTVTVVCTAALVGSITVTPQSIVLGTGAAQQLTATGTLGGNCAPATVVRDFTYRSSDTTVATVSATGLVSGRRNGTAVITVAQAATPTISQAVQVTVRDPGASRVTLQSITTGDPPVPVDLGAVRGQIRTRVNVAPVTGIDARRVELWLAGRRAAVTDTVPRATDGSPSSVTLDVNTAARDESGARLYPNGAVMLEARVYFGVPGISDTQLATASIQLTLANP